AEGGGKWDIDLRPGTLDGAFATAAPSPDRSTEPGEEPPIPAVRAPPAVVQLHELAAHPRARKARHQGAEPKETAVPLPEHGQPRRELRRTWGSSGACGRDRPSHRRSGRANSGALPVR